MEADGVIDDELRGDRDFPPTLWDPELIVATARYKDGPELTLEL